MCWPTLFFHRRWRDHTQEAPGILEFLYQRKAAQGEHVAPRVAVRAKSHYGIYESDFDLFTHPHPGLARLLGFICQSLANAVCHLELAVVESWFHITNGGGFHDAHLHPNCSWCGIYYLQVGDSGAAAGGGAPNGGTRFYSPLTLGYRDAGNFHQFDELDAPVQDGMLVLFPSYLRHSGLPYAGERDRVVIAFNARVFREGVPSSVRP
jgi:uncharacterized protein (TIGR02466 family)